MNKEYTREELRKLISGIKPLDEDIVVGFLEVMAADCLAKANDKLFRIAMSAIHYIEIDKTSNTHQ